MPVTKQEMKYWNNGLTAKEVFDKHGIDVIMSFTELENKIGCRSLSIAELYSGEIGAKPRKRESSDEYKRWKGEIGYGKQLRDMLKNI